MFHFFAFHIILCCFVLFVFFPLFLLKLHFGFMEFMFITFGNFN